MIHCYTLPVIAGIRTLSHLKNKARELVPRNFPGPNETQDQRRLAGARPLFSFLISNFTFVVLNRSAVRCIAWLGDWLFIHIIDGCEVQLGSNLLEYETNWVFIYIAPNLVMDPALPFLRSKERSFEAPLCGFWEDHLILLHEVLCRFDVSLEFVAVNRELRHGGQGGEVVGA
jgi:hypothetical protein